MTNKFTLENTKDATHVCFTVCGQIAFYKNIKSGIGCEYNVGLGWTRSSSVSSACKELLDLTDQTGRGYPTLEWFLKCGYKLEVGDEINPGWRPSQVLDAVLDADLCTFLNKPSHENSWLYVISTHDNRLDLTAMARDEYYSKHEKQWPTEEESARMIPIGQNGNNGEHYESEPVYTQEIMLNKQAGWVKAIVTHKGKRFTTFQVESGREYSRKNSKLKIRELDTRTDDEKLRDAVTAEVEKVFTSSSATKALAGRIIKKFTITLNKEG